MHQSMFLPFEFSIQQFFVHLFYCQKTAFECEFWHTPLSEINFFSMFTPPMGMRFCRRIPNSPKDKNKMSHNPYLLEKVVFWAFKTLLSPFGTGNLFIFGQL
jgi:hypothetical protein